VWHERGDITVKIYGQHADAPAIPIDAAIASLERAKQRLLDLDRPR
jgi:hypothetical protein